MPRQVTYSIVARDAATAALGVAVQSHWFSVGSVVTWGRAGVGTVATQSIADPAYGPRLLDALASGEEPEAALQRLVAADAQGRFRQVACVRADGAIAVHTGAGCIPFAGDATGAGFSAQALALAPDNHELLFWAGLGIAQSGDLEEGLKLVRRAIELQPGWRDLIGRLSPEIAPSAAQVAAAL